MKNSILVNWGITATLALILLSYPFAAFSRPQTTDGKRGVGVKAFAGEVSRLPDKAKRFALIIGIDHYRDAQISPLKGAATDAKSLAGALARYAGFPPEQIILLSTDQPEERQPTRVNILRRLSNLTSTVPKDGLLLISFAGHGIARGGRAYILPSDSQLSDDTVFLEDTAISVERMHERIKATGVGQVIVLLDACRNDPAGRADAPNPLTTAYTKGFNFDVRNREVLAYATLYATEIGGRAYEYTEKRQGYFTWAVVQGLSGGAADERGEVTLASLVKYIQEVVPKRVGIDLGGGKRQRPLVVIDGYRANELVIAVAKPGATGVDAPTSVPAEAVENSYWESIKDSRDPADFKAYLEKYPRGPFAAAARQRLSGLTQAPAREDKGQRGRQHDYDATYKLLTALERLIQSSSMSGDKKMLDGILADDFVLTDSGKVYNKSQYLSKVPTKNIKSYTFDSFVLELDGDVAILSGSGRAVVKQLFLMAKVRVNFIDRFELRPGKGWQLVASQVKSTLER